MSDYCRRCQQHFAYCGCTEIERLSDRIEELEAERDHYAEKLMQSNNTYTEMHLLIEELEAENARLWDALEVYANKLEEHEIEAPVLSRKLKGEPKE